MILFLTKTLIEFQNYVFQNETVDLFNEGDS